MSMDPVNRFGPFGSGRGSLGNFNSPPPSYTASREKKTLRWDGLQALQGCEVLLPEFGGSHNLSNPVTGRRIVVQENPE